MFKGPLAEEMFSYIELRKNIVSSDMVRLDTRCLISLDKFMLNNCYSEKYLSEDLFDSWVPTLSGKSNTVGYKIVSVRGFAKYLCSLGINCFIPRCPKAKSTYIPYIYSDDEITQIFYCADNLYDLYHGKGSPHPYVELMIPMVLRILYGCGTRIGETMELKRMDIDFKQGTIDLRVTKNSKERVIPIHSTLLELLERYCLVIGIMDNPQGYLFPGMKPNSHYTTREVHFWCDRILKKLGIDQGPKEYGEKGASLHCFRHLFVLKSMKQLEELGHPVDVNDLLLPTYLGHSDLIDTDNYMRFSGVQMPETIDRFDNYSYGIIPNVEEHYEEE